ncbi:YIP1 family protein [Peribacillus sp. FSL H8-0477]|uniref:YIP1 family protein n=1 Tax=Peribacillus sp. FSL H8-0477 TaxID=2921388 RepID=UPI0030F7E079
METVKQVNENEKEKPSILGMIGSPSAQFVKMRYNPAFAMALTIVTGLFIIGMWLTTFTMDQIYEGLDLSGEELDIAILIGKVTAVITGILSAGLGALFSSVILLLIAKIVRSGVTFKQLFSMNIHLMVISALGLILNTAVGIAIDQSSTIYFTSLAGVLNSDSAVLGSIELFSIWSAVLLGFGLQKTADFSKTASWVVVILTLLFSVGLAFMGTLFTGLTS